MFLVKAAPEGQESTVTDTKVDTEPADEILEAMDPAEAISTEARPDEEVPVTDAPEVDLLEKETPGAEFLEADVLKTGSKAQPVPDDAIAVPGEETDAAEKSDDSSAEEVIMTGDDAAVEDGNE